MELRWEGPDDVSVVAEVHRAAFGDCGDRVAAVVDDLRVALEKGDGVSLVAEFDGAIVGHVMFSAGSTRPVGSSPCRS